MSDKIRFIYLIKPINFLLPYVPKPQHQIKTSEKLVWTGMVLFIYLVCSQIPLYGIYRMEGADPLHYMRVILASSRNSLMELGITPSLTASMLMNILVIFKVIEVDRNLKEDIYLFEQATKFITILITFGESIAYVGIGMYGDINQIGIINSILIILQLFFAGILVIILDEILSNGYGMVSGISLFIATNISENILWKSLSPFTITTERGVEYEGSIITLFYLLLIKKNKVQSLYRAFFRQNSPNLMNLLATFLIFYMIIYLRGFKYNLKIISRNQPGLYINHEIKLFYSSTTPIILLNTAMSNIYFISQILYERYSKYFLIKLIGTWKDVDGEKVATGGIAYFLTPPNNFSDFIISPLKSFIYVIFILVISGLFTRTLVELSGKSARDVAKGLKQSGFFLEGIRENEESIYKRLERIIPTVATLGGICIGAFQILADLMGALGSGTGILLLVSYIVDFVAENNNDGEKENIAVLKD